MKKLLLASVAITGLAFAAPAHADVELELGGYFKGYGAFVNQDETAGTDVAGFDMVRDTEIHIGGETTLDNGLTVGAHFELDADGNDSATSDESYVYFSGNWGRVNVGAESGAGYLLQVSAPAADSNIDGIAQYVSPFMTTGNLTAQAALDYNMADSAKNDKITYLSPVMSGFQLGVSYTPDTGMADDYTISLTDGTIQQYEEGYEIGVRYEGDFEEVGVVAGAGYSVIKEDGTTTTATDDQEMWNVGLDVDVAAFGIGAIYMEDNNGEAGTGATAGDTETMVVGADYTTGPFKIGVSYYNSEDKATSGVEYDRYTGGVVYEYGPGMSFRGSIQLLEQDNPTGTADADGTAILLGTQINF